MLTGGRLVSFAGNTIRIGSDHQGISEAVEAYFKHCPAVNGPVIADYRIAASSEADFYASENGSDLFLRADYESALWQLMQAVFTRLNGAASTRLVFHAAALASAQDGIILCGKSGSGKSSLAAWLLANGLKYLGDEVIALEANGAEKISGLPRSLVLKHGSAFIWQRRLPQPGAKGLLRFANGSAWVDPDLLNSDAVLPEIAPRVLIFPHYISGACQRVERLSPAQALFNLLQCLVNARNLPDHGLPAASRLARQVIAFDLIYSDIESATQWIQQTALAG